MKRAGIAALSLTTLVALAASLQADTLTKLLETLDKAPPHQRVVLVKKIGNLGRQARDAIPVLQNLLHAPDDELADQAARSLAQIGPESVPLLTEASQNVDPRVSLRALWALSVIGPDAEPAIPILVELLDHPKERNRAGALYALGEIGRAAGPATAQIVRSIRTKSMMVRYQAVTALGKIGTVAVPELRRLLNDDEAGVRADAALALSLYGKLAKPALDELRHALKDESDDVRAKAAYAIGAMEKDGNPALPNLVDLLQDPEYDVQVAAFQATVQVGVGDPKLMEALRLANQKGKWATPFILKQFGKNPGDAVQPLIKKLKEKDAMERMGAAWALGQIGAPARDAVAPLQKILKDPLPQARVVAFNALKQIDQELILDQNPLLREWHEALERQIDGMRLVQVKFQNSVALDSRKDHFKIALRNPHIQMHYDQLTQIYVAMAVNGNPRNPQLERLFDHAGPEAIPALVKAVNMVANLNFGFT
ncbi:MAG: HEAT repeat domain-containing protein [Gemmataceae bacterium]|nr:HEAT repeat domain-containing protein [Gemmataceae bacterium]